jgi:hypothetical protein
VVDVINKAELEKWLQNQPHEVSIVISTRAALRILPVFNELPTIKNQQTNDIILPVFHALTLPWAAAKYLAHGKELRALAPLTLTAADRAAAAAAIAATTADRAATAAGRATTAIGRAAIRANRAATLANRAATLASHATAALTAAALTAAALTAATLTTAALSAAALSAAIATDVRLIDNNKSPQEVAQSPLWHGDPPSEITEDWQNLKTKLLALDEDWQVWTDWYEARLYGQPDPIEKLEIARATIDEEIWEQGPAVVNAHIKELIEKYTPQNTEDILKQRPAPYLYFTDKDGRIDANPMPGTPLSPDMTEDLRQELLKKAQKLKERLVSTQTPKKILDTIDQLIESLGHKLDDVKPGILLSKSYSLEADINAYDTEQGRQELAEDVLASMLDVNATLTALKGCYPEIAEIEAAALAQKLTGAMAGEVLQQTKKIIEAARISTDAVTKRALEGLESELPEIWKIQKDIETEIDEDKRASALEKLGKRASYHLLSVRNFITAVINKTKRATPIVVEKVKKTRIAFTKNLKKNQKEAVTAATFALLSESLLGPVGAIAVFSFSFWALLYKELETSKDDDEESDKDKVDPDNN